MEYPKFNMRTIFPYIAQEPAYPPCPPSSTVPVLTAFLQERELLVSPEKSTVTLFSHDTNEYNVHPKVYVDDKLVKLDPEPKLLGVIFDTTYIFSKQTKKSLDRAKSKSMF